MSSAEVNQLRAALASLQNENKKLRTQKQAMMDEIEELRAELESTESASEGPSSRRSVQHNGGVSYAKLRSENSELRAEVKSLESQVVKQTLRVEPRNDLVWPIGEALNRSALDALNGQGTRTALMRPEAIAGPADTLRPSPVRGSNITAQPVDPLLSNAMDPSRGSNPSSTAPSPPRPAGSPSG